MRAPEFWRRNGWAAAALGPAGRLYDLVGRLRRRAAPWHAPVPVICVGNLVAGGAGKTPVVLALAAWLQQRGIAVHLLSRGYGGAEPGPLRVDPARLLLGRSGRLIIGVVRHQREIELGLGADP